MSSAPNMVYRHSYAGNNQSLTNNGQSSASNMGQGYDHFNGHLYPSIDRPRHGDRRRNAFTKYRQSNSNKSDDSETDSCDDMDVDQNVHRVSNCRGKLESSFGTSQYGREPRRVSKKKTQPISNTEQDVEMVSVEMRDRVTNYSYVPSRFVPPTGNSQVESQPRNSSMGQGQLASSPKKLKVNVNLYLRMARLY